MIGIYGGTFNPVHYGHLRTALEIKDLLGLSELRLVPCRLPPHREEPDVTAKQRFEMLQLAIAGSEGMLVDPCELQREGPSYMVDTLAAIKQSQPNETLVLIMGMDAFQGLEGWSRWQQLFDLAHIVVMTRPGFNIQTLGAPFVTRVVENIEELSRQSSGGLWFQEVTQLNISATQIRALLADQGDVRFLMPEQVLDFIKRHNLYRAVV